jgi:uncharacterized protein
MKHIYRVATHWSLLIHIYVSMTGFTLVLLFAITGLTLNHQDFGLSDPEISRKTISLPAALLENPEQASVSRHLQDTLGIRTKVTDYRDDDAEIQVIFAAPGRRTLVTIRRAEHLGEVETETRGLLGKLDDLHKGFDAGRAWYWMIDVTAILLTISSLTGMVTLFSLRTRRRSGFLVGAMGIATVVLIYVVWVPH